MFELDEEKTERLKEIFAKYAISSLENVKEICAEKNIDVEKVVTEVKADAPEVAKLAFSLGTAIAIKKDTKLASYVAYDIGEAIQLFCSTTSEAQDREAGFGIGNQAALRIKEETSEDEMVDYASMLDFMGMSGDEMIEIIKKLSALVEAAMKD